MSKPQSITIVYPVDFESGQNKGIYDKMISQGEAFHSLGIETNYLFIEGKKTILKSLKENKTIGSTFSKRWNKFHSFFTCLKQISCDSDIVYIRHLLHTKAQYQFIKSLKKRGVQVIYEYPTFPYKMEWKSYLQRLLIKQDEKYNLSAEKEIDLIVHYGGYDGSRPSVEITNGIKINHSPFQFERKKEDGFNIIAVGRWEYWHGLDRLIKGLPKSEKKIKLHIIGHGPSLKSYLSLVKELGIEKRVIVHPPSYNEGLTEIMAMCHLGIGTLGLHRKKVKLDSSLKHRMYCSFGLPFLYAGEDLDFPEDLPFVFKANSDESIIDVDSLIASYNVINVDHHIVHNYASANLTWVKRMKKVHSALNSI